MAALMIFLASVALAALLVPILEVFSSAETEASLPSALSGSAAAMVGIIGILTVGLFAAAIQAWLNKVR